MPAELPRSSLDNVLIKLVEGMVYSPEPHEQCIPRGSRSKKTLTFRQLLFEKEVQERDVTEHMGVVGPTVDGYKLAYIDGRISDDANVDFCIMKHKKVIAKVEMKLIKSKHSAQRDFGARDLERQMLLVAEGRHSNSVVNQGLEGNYGIVAEHVDGDRGAFSDVMQIALFKWDGQKRKPILFCFIPVWRPSTSEGASSGGGGSSGSGVGGKRKDGGSSGSSKKAKA